MTSHTDRVCAKCGSRNRIPFQHLAHPGRCGSCRAELPPQHKPVDVDRAAFDSIVQQVAEPVIVDFWAQWCGPCRASAPEFERLAEEMAGQAIFLKVDVDAEQELAARFRVSSIPFLVTFLNGKAIHEQRGWPGQAAVAQNLRSLRRQAAAI